MTETETQQARGGEESRKEMLWGWACMSSSPCPPPAGSDLQRMNVLLSEQPDLWNHDSTRKGWPRPSRGLGRGVRSPSRVPVPGHCDGMRTAQQRAPLQMPKALLPEEKGDTQFGGATRPEKEMPRGPLGSHPS